MLNPGIVATRKCKHCQGQILIRKNLPRRQSGSTYTGLFQANCTRCHRWWDTITNLKELPKLC